VGGDAERVYGADAVDRINAWRADNGDVVWSSERMLNRGLSGALAMGTLVVFGDYEGYVHFLDAATGATQLRLATDGSQVIGAPQMAGQTLLLLYTGSRADFHILGLDRDGAAADLWSMSADNVSPTKWNDDWDSSPLMIDDYLFEGGENGQWYILKLNRHKGADGKIDWAKVK